MNDPMDNWLARLPRESPSPDLAARINLAVVRRASLRARWRRGGIVAGSLGLIGVALMAISWASSGALPAAPDPSAFLEAAGSVLSSPLEAVGGSAQAALTWESSLAEGVEIAFLMGAVLLTLASAVGLARLLRGGGSVNGYSQ